MTRQAILQASYVAAGRCQSCGKRPIAKKIEGAQGPAPKRRCRTCLRRKRDLAKKRLAVATAQE